MNIIVTVNHDRETAVTARNRRFLLQVFVNVLSWWNIILKRTKENSTVSSNWCYPERKCDFLQYIFNSLINLLSRTVRCKIIKTLKTISLQMNWRKIAKKISHKSKKERFSKHIDNVINRWKRSSLSQHCAVRKNSVIKALIIRHHISSIDRVLDCCSWNICTRSKE